MQLHELQRSTPHKKEKRVGRGGKRGKTSGRGHKGQKARAGGTPRPALRDIVKKIPKRRGYGKNRARTVYGNRPALPVVNLADLEKRFDAGDTISPATLREKGLVRTRGNRIQGVKILGQGSFTKACTFEKCVFSQAAREAVEKAGSTIVS